MLYYDALATLLLMLLPAAVIGWRLADLLPWRLRPEGKVFFSPLMGLAVLLHVVVLSGWIGHGYHRPACLLILAVLLFASLWRTRDITTQMRHALLLVVFAIVTTAGVLYPAWRYAVLSPYNDTFTYLMHGQWLQRHGFAEPAVRSGNYPALSQVLCYQVMGMRMGSSFMLGYVQALMGADWSYQVYPAVVAIPIVACALVVAQTAYSVCRRLLLSLLWGAAIGLTLNGISYGVSNGFMPQTWGLAFVVGSLALATPILRHSAAHSTTKTALGHWIPVALLLSAAIHCYSEISPFLVATMGLVFVVAAIHLRRHLSRLLIIAGWLGCLCAILVNLEWVRIVRSLRTQASAVVGMAVNWPWWHFLSHAMGLRTGVHDADLYLLGRPAMGVACIVGTGLVAVGLGWYWRHRGRIWDLVPHLTFLSLLTLAFVYFRLVAASPWPTGTGQSWNQFKLGNWATPSMFCLLAAGIAALGRKSAVRSGLLSVGLLGILAAGTICQIRLAESRTHAIRQDTGLLYDPMSAFLSVRQFSGDIPGDSPIYLDVGDGRIGARQMLMYLLQDRAVAGHWNDDEWVKHWLPPDQREISMQGCKWIVSMDSRVPPTARRAGNLWLGPSPDTFFALQSSTGGYGREMDRTGWWQWTARQLRFTYRIQGEHPARVLVSFTYLAVSDHQPTRLSVGGKTLELFFNTGWHDWASPPIEIGHMGDTLEVAFDGDSPPVKLSDADPRMASYLIKNLVLRPVD